LAARLARPSCPVASPLLDGAIPIAGFSPADTTVNAVLMDKNRPFLLWQIRGIERMLQMLPPAGVAPVS
jgi:hypothetical protein